MHTNNNPGSGDAGVGGSSRKLPTNNQTKPPPQEWKLTATNTLVILRSKFPATFGKWQPLKIGIRDDIIVALPEIDPIYIARALRFHASHIRYLQSCVEGRERIDLAGMSAGTVTADEAGHCAAKWQRGKPATSVPPKKPISLADLKVAARKRSGGLS